ncbi:MAG: threonine/serine dehydratase [Gemmatimonadota bacterium]
MDLRAEALAAAERIRGHVRQTPVERSAHLEAVTGGRVYLKLENYQLTGSFKLRGAMNALLSLTREQRSRGVVAASSGNHGAAVACGAAQVGCRAAVFVPHGAQPSKLAMIRAWGAEVREVGEDCVEAEAAARRYAADHGLSYVSPYNDERVVAGQATVGVELARQVGRIDAVFVSLGGGGLISGTGGYLKAVAETEVIACSPENSRVMHASLEVGRLLEMPSLPTLSDGTAGGVEAGAITFELCRKVVDDSLLVSEAEIAAAMRLILAHQHMLIEGAAGVAVAGVVRTAERWRDRNVAIVLCGANVGIDVLTTVLSPGNR